MAAISSNFYDCFFETSQSEIAEFQKSPLHAAIFAGKVEQVEVLLAGMKDEKEKASKDLALTKYKITPLTLGVMCKQAKIVALLLRANVNIEATDGQRFTAAHHAVIQKDQKLIELLHNAGANFDAINGHAHTPRDYSIMVNSTRPTAIYVMEDGEIKSVSSVKYFPSFSHFTVIASKTLIEIWKLCTNDPEHSLDDQPMQYRSAVEAPQVYLKQHEKRGWELYAAKSFKEQEKICGYGGIVRSLATASKTHSFIINGVAIDGELVKSYGSLASDSFPNAYIQYRGITATLTALCPIAKDEPICIHYGVEHPVKAGPHQELRLEAIKTYLSEIPLEKRLHLNNKEKIVKIDFQGKYLFETPTTLVTLIYKKILKPENLNGLPFFSNYSMNYCIRMASIYLSFSEWEGPFKDLILDRIMRENESNSIEINLKIFKEGLLTDLFTCLQKVKPFRELYFQELEQFFMQRVKKVQQ